MIAYDLFDENIGVIKKLFQIESKIKGSFMEYFGDKQKSEDWIEMDCFNGLIFKPNHLRLLVERT